MQKQIAQDICHPFWGFFPSAERKEFVRRLPWVLSLFLILFLWGGQGALEAAGQPGRLLSDEGAGARGLALGSAYTAVARDNTALYWNPAGLGQVLQPQVSAMHVSPF